MEIEEISHGISKNKQPTVSRTKQIKRIFFQNYLLQNSDLDELRLHEGIQVWGTKQETLEEQALKELDIFSEEKSNLKRRVGEEYLEEGEIFENSTSKTNDKLPQPSLDLETYIKSQESLRKRQLFQKSLACTNASKEIADRISNKLKRPSKKQKKSEEKSITKCHEVSNAPEFKDIDDKVIYNNNIINDSEDQCGNQEDNSGSEYIPSDIEFGELKTIVSCTIWNI